MGRMPKSSLPSGSFAIMAAYKRYTEFRAGANMMLWGWLACMVAAVCIFFGDLFGRMGILSLDVSYPWSTAYSLTVAMLALGLWGRLIWLSAVKRREEALSRYRGLCQARDMLNPY